LSDLYMKSLKIRMCS